MKRSSCAPDASVFRSVPFFKFVIAAAILCGALSTSVHALAQADVNPQSAVAGNVKKASLGRRLVDKVASLDIGHTFDLVEGDIFESVGAAVRYRYQVEPSYNGDFHTRMDRWTLEASVHPGDILTEHEGSTAGLNLRRGANVLFVRQFKDRSQAFRAAPYTLANIPFTTRRLVEKLEVGDFVALTSDLNLMVGGSLMVGSGAVAATIATHYLLSGEFQIHITKVSKDKIRMKLIAVRKKELDGSISVGFPGLKITGVEVVDRRIRKWTDLTNVFTVGASSGKSNLLMVDYMMDTSDSAVTLAYDGVMSSALELKELGIANPFSDNTELTSRLISDITPFEAIFENEKQKPVENRSIDRLFKGKNDIEDNVKSRFKFGLVFFRFDGETEYAENLMTSVDQNDQNKYYRLHTYQRTNRDNYFFSWSKEESISRATILFSADDKHNIDKMLDISFEWEYKDKWLRGNEVGMIQGAVRQALPESIYQKIDWKDWSPRQSRDNARFRYRMVFHPSAYYAIGNLGSPDDVEKRLRAFIKTIPEPESSAMPTPRYGPRGQFPIGIERYKRDIQLISEQLSKVFSADAKISKDARSLAFSELRRSALFVEIGPGFLVSLIPSGQVEKLMYFELSLTGDGANTVTWQNGTLANRSVFEAGSYIQAVLNNRVLDFVNANEAPQWAVDPAR